MSDYQELYWQQRYNVQAETLSRLKQEFATKTEIIERQRNERIQDKKTIAELREAIQALRQELEKRHSDASSDGSTLESSFRSSSLAPRSTWPNKSQTYATLDSQWKSVSKSTASASYPVKAKHVDPDDDVSEGSAEDEQEDSHLFEEFFMVGVKPAVEPSENVKAEVLLQYPGLSFTAEKSASHGVKRAALAEFCFPEGIKSTEFIKVTEDPRLPDLLCEEPDLNRSDDAFVFCMRVRDDEAFLTSMELDRPNKDKNLVYGVCLKFKDVLVIGKELWLVPKCFCLLSYHACFDLHHKVLAYLRKIKRLRRLSVVMKGRTEPRLSRGFRQALSRLTDFGAEEMVLLTTYFSYPETVPGQQVVLSLEKLGTIVYQMPPLGELDTRWCCPTLFSALNLPDLFVVLSAVMCEKSVVFVSERLGLLTSCV